MKGIQGERGAALYEYALVLPLFTVIITVIAAMGWWWWSQSVVAVAIHDGVRDAAAHDGNIALGYETTMRLLGSHLGRYNAEQYEKHIRIWRDDARRSVVGRIHMARVVSLPFLGPHLFEVEASSFQRRWEFYGGPPDTWE